MHIILCIPHNIYICLVYLRKRASRKSTRSFAPDRLYKMHLCGISACSRGSTVHLAHWMETDRERFPHLNISFFLNEKHTPVRPFSFMFHRNLTSPQIHRFKTAATWFQYAKISAHGNYQPIIIHQFSIIIVIIISAIIIISPISSTQPPATQCNSRGNELPNNTSINSSESSAYQNSSTR